jgi:hypothetical protein
MSTRLLPISTESRRPHLPHTPITTAARLTTQAKPRPSNNPTNPPNAAHTPIAPGSIRSTRYPQHPGSASHSHYHSITPLRMVRPAGLLSNRYKLEDMPDLTGKVAVVVGGSRGIGEAASAALIKKGAEGESARHDADHDRLTQFHPCLRRLLERRRTSRTVAEYLSPHRVRYRRARI